MAINLNHSIYGRQFAEFADFAKVNEGSPDTLVRIGVRQLRPGRDGEPVLRRIPEDES